MVKQEYKIENVDLKDIYNNEWETILLEKLNHFGKDGWILCDYKCYSQPSQHYRLILRREIEK